ncbi:branched-chain amino acid aminotransferase [Leucobacter ruminantium]|uniref:Branched-chain-amino-acid aminotransferase n=1 Tax=Leucobacter ruminantium TaxID=1289170 RepID=A0A939RYK3_9MICO|nr:branched-chain amino acid aminotransferase [Leucobacter ruminantium]MBO1804534.1 branched-chain amino acid aminotransferase [Leucobacter ruminantium]
MLQFTLPAESSPTTVEERARILAAPGFGKHYTDHMAVGRWSQDRGWHDLHVDEPHDFSLHPATAALHYGQEIFEGLKAYRHPDQSIWLFRPEANAARFAHSARRLGLPELDERLFLDAVTRLVHTDQAWVPAHGGETSLYIRPCMFASEPFLGVRPASEATFFTIASPAGPYFADGPVGISLWVSRVHARATPGGTGDAKCGGNYAAGLAAQTEARRHGCDQVLFLDGAEHEWLEESGTMNVFLITQDGELITPELGTILEGVTRDSVLALAREHGLTPVERRIGMTEVRERCTAGTITEMFATGTAAAITPINRLLDGDEITIGGGDPGRRTIALREHLLGIQHGTRPDTRGWLTRVA